MIGILLLVLLMPLPAWATTYWVSATGGTGTDATACSSIDGPTDPGVYRRSVIAGANCMTGGDTLMIKDGTYTEDFTNCQSPFGAYSCWPSGSSGAPTIVKAVNPRTVTLRNADTAFRDNVVYIANHHHITFDGLKFDGGGPVPAHLAIIMFKENVNNIILDNVEIYNTTPAAQSYPPPNLVLGGCDSCSIINSSLHDNDTNLSGNSCANCPCPGCNGTTTNCDDTCGPFRHGIYGLGHDMVLDNNDIYNISGVALHYHHECDGSHSDRATVTRNRIHHSGLSTFGAAMVIDGGIGPSKIANNIFHDNPLGIYGFYCTSGTYEIFNNTFYNTDIAVQHRARESEGNNADLLSINNIVDQATTPFDDVWCPGDTGCPGGGQTRFTAGGGQVSTNLCTNAGVGCTLTGNPDFRNVPLRDFHLQSTSPAVNAGLNFAGVPDTDIEGNPRIGTVDIGAFECQNPLAADCTAAPPQPIGAVALLKCDGNLTDSENGFLFTGSGGVLTNGAPLVDGNSCVFNGTSALITGPDDAAFRSANIGWAFWYSSTTPPADFCHLMRIGTVATLGLASDGTLYAFVNNNQTVAGTINVADGLIHLLGLGYDGTTLRLWLDNANPWSMNVGNALSYAGTEQLTIGGSTGHFCQFRADNIYINDGAWTATGMQEVFNDRGTPAMGLSFTHWRFYQADAPEGTTIAGQGVDAPNIVQARSGKLLMGVNAKRNGSTINEHIGLECNVNGGPFAPIDNSCALNPACITTDSVKNMGDPTTDLGDIPGDGFTFTPGRYVVDTINSGLQTTLADGQFTVWRYGLAFRQTLAHEDVVRCRPRTASGAFDSYPAVLPTITIDAPGGFVGGSARMQGGQSRGGTRR